MNVRRQGRPALALVPQPSGEPAPLVAFCGHCGAQPGRRSVQAAASRVCESCGLGLLLEAGADVAPVAGGAFIVLNSALAVCAVSAGAEELLATTETAAVNRHVTELIVPADAEASERRNLATAIVWAARGETSARTITVRPANTFGIRISARIATCGPPTAALLVFPSGPALRPVAAS